MMKQVFPTVAISTWLAFGLSGALTVPAAGVAMLPGAAFAQDEASEVSSFGAVIVAHLPGEMMFFQNDVDPQKRGGVSYDVYEGDSLADLLSMNEDEEVDIEPPAHLLPSEVAPTLEAAVKVVRSSGVDTFLVYFVSDTALEHATRRDRRRLAALVERRAVVAGVHGSSTHLREQLGLASVPDAKPDRRAEVLNLVRVNKNARHLEEHSLEIPQAPTDGAQFAQAFLDVDEWQLVRRRRELDAGSAALEELPADPPEPWQALYSTEWRGQIIDIVPWDGSQQHSGNWDVELFVWLLGETSSTGARWYLIQVQPASEIVSYKNKYGVCGWWTAELDTAVGLNEGEWKDFMPTGTVNNSSSTFTIGASFGEDGPDVNASFTLQYGGPDVQIINDFDAEGNSWQYWNTTLVGCRDKALGFFSGASNDARHSYKVNPAVTVRVEAGQKLDFELSAPSISDPDTRNFTSVVHEKQNIIVGDDCDRVERQAICVETPSARVEAGFVCDQTTCQAYTP